jgi:erythritol kinase
LKARKVILALDAGTSVLKAVAFDLNGQPAGIATHPNHYTERPGGIAEQNMAETWANAAHVIAELAERLEDAEIIGIGITGQGDGTWLIDNEGEPVAPALLWLDARAGVIAERLRTGDAGRAIFTETGTGIAACNQSAQLLWLAEAHPEMLRRAATAFHCKDWLYFKLTGVRATDPSEAAFTFGSWRQRNYSDVTIAALGLQRHRHLLPPVVNGTRTHHPLAAETARALGLKAGLPVVLGYVDIVASALGAGVFGTGVFGTGDPDNEEGAGTSIIGSTGINMRLANDDFAPPPDAPVSGYRMAFPVPGKTALVQSTLAATLNIDWLLGIADQAVELAGHQSDRLAMLAALDGLVLAARPASALYHPYVLAAGERGPFTNAHARASLAGIDRGLTLPGMMRSVYEGLALAAADCYAAMGGAPGVISITGGASRSAALRHIFAAMLNRPVRIITEHGSGALGAAMIAALALGIMPDMKSCASRWVTPLLGAAEPPDPDLVAAYAPLLPIYQRARGAAPPFWREFGAYQEARHGP